MALVYKTSNKTNHLQSKFMFLEQCAKFFASNSKYQYAQSMTFPICEIVLLANRFVNPYVDFQTVASKLLTPKLGYTAVALHLHDWLIKVRTRRYALIKATRNLSNVDFLYAVHEVQ